jgi:hypothetical protein
VASECALKSAVSKTKGTRCDVSLLGEKEGDRAVLRFIFV